MIKKKVNYVPEVGVIYSSIHNQAIIGVVDHPNNRLGRAFAKTSRIISWDKESGVIETANTIYTPQKNKYNSGILVDQGEVICLPKAQLKVD